MSDQKESIYNKQFWLLCLSSFLFFSSFNMIIAELPSFLDRLGGGVHKGLIIALFTLTAGISRPFSGKLADCWGRVPVMVFGALVSCLMSLFYPLIGSVFLFFVIRFFHGFSTGFNPTGTTSFVADIIPIHRRGEAIGLLGLSGSLGMAFGPAIGSSINLYFGDLAMFLSSSGVAVLSLVSISGMKETLKNPAPFRFSMLKLGKYDWFEPKVWIPAIVMVFALYPYGVILTIMPDFASSLGLENKGYIFTCFTVSSISVRFFAGKVSDAIGRRKVLIIAMTLLSIAMFGMSFSDTLFMLFCFIFVFGLGAGMGSPSVFAWAIDLSDDKYRGRAMATVYMALELGIGSGALFTGMIYANNPQNISICLAISGALCIAALLILVGSSASFRRRFIKVRMKTKFFLHT